MNALPHEFPFLFIDQILELIPGERGKFSVHWSANGFFISSTIPPSFFQALLLEAMAEGAGLVLGSGPGNEISGNLKKGYLLRLDRGSFGPLPKVGDEIIISIRKRNVFGPMARFEAQAGSEEHVLIKTELTLWLEPGESGDRS